MNDKNLEAIGGKDSGPDPWEILLSVRQGKITREQARELVIPLRVKLFWKPLISHFEPDDGFWSPNMCIAWIAYGDQDKVDEIAEKRWSVEGFWEKRLRPREAIDEKMEAEVLDLIGGEVIPHREYYDCRFWLLCGDDQGLDRPMRKRNAAKELWCAAASKQLEFIAIGLRDGLFPPVEIPAAEWPYLRFAQHFETIPLLEDGRVNGTWSPSISRPDTLFAPDGSCYRRVRFPADAVKKLWPIATGDNPNEALASGAGIDNAKRSAYEERVLPEVKTFLENAIKEIGGFVGQEDGAKIVLERYPQFRKKPAMLLVKSVTNNTKVGRPSASKNVR